MTILTVRAALQKLHQEQASALIRNFPIDWPDQILAKDLPMILVKRGDGTWYRQGPIIVQARLWYPQIFLAEANQYTLALAENMAIPIAQLLGEIYTVPANQTLALGGEPCLYATVLQNQQDRDTGIQDTEVGIIAYRGKDYYGFEYRLPISEKTQ